MCSGGDNRKSRKQVDAENEAAKRQYEYQLEVRRREWNQALTIYGANKIDFKTAQERAGRKLGNAYAKLDIVRRNETGNVLLKNEARYVELLNNDPGAKMAAKGRTGASGRRVEQSALAASLRKSAEDGRKLTELKYASKDKADMIRLAALEEQDERFAKVWVQPIPGVMPPPPMKQHRGKKKGFFSSLLGIAGTGASIYGAFGSDIKLKENIKQVGKSPKGYKIYEWNYKVDKNTRYRGVIAQDVVKINPMAVTVMDGGHLGVYYDKVDVPMEVVS